ncbi:MAG: response regulator [Candidatus Hydrogenedentes bacterium]|nr:response regulator [Candidatus Hydrogenedentota bacterium]
MNQMLILLVEDNPDDVELTIRGFKKNNFSNEIVIARDGQEALDFLYGTGDFEGRDSTRQPTLVLLDINLPRIGGLEVLRRMRADDRTRRVPVVLLTSSKEDSDIKAGYDLGANSYVRKPVDFVQFTEAVRQLNLYWLLLNEPVPSIG